MSNIQIRIDKKDKIEAKKIFDRLGLDMSSAIKLFLRQTSIRKTLPFVLITDNGMSVEDEIAILEASKQVRAGKNVSPVMSDKKAVEYLKKI